jgi:hypothetical protein
VYTRTEEKNRLNKKKHGFYLSDIVDVFDDPHLLEFYDAAHSPFSLLRHHRRLYIAPSARNAAFVLPAEGDVDGLAALLFGELYRMRGSAGHGVAVEVVYGGGRSFIDERVAHPNGSVAPLCSQNA